MTDDNPAPPHATRKPSGWATVLLVLLVCFVLVALVILEMSYRGPQDHRKEAEVKSGLHAIQVAVERYALDHDGEYPQYLIGGEAKYSTLEPSDNGPGELVNIQAIPTNQVSDPLLREGYLTEYPRNPFVRTGIYIHQDQTALISAKDGCDPLRNDSETGKLFGTRFGPKCQTMGSVLADPRFTERDLTELDSQTEIKVPTYADIEYEFWDMWIGNKPLPYIAGQFFYKSAGPMESSGFSLVADDRGIDTSSNAIAVPTSIVKYILGAYGGLRSKGKDILGEEQPGFHASEHPERTGEKVSVEFWLWTRSEISADPADVEGSPYMPNPDGDLADPVQYGNPNGIRDGIILVLTDGS